MSIAGVGQHKTAIHSDLKSDSLFQQLLRSMDIDRRKEFTTYYLTLTPAERKMLGDIQSSLTLSFPVSSKQALIDNYQSHISDIDSLRTLFESLVPSDKEVYLLLNDSVTPFNRVPTVDFWCFQKDSSWNRKLYFQQWNVPLPSTQLDSLLQQVGWTRNTLAQLRGTLKAANCISIANKEYLEIGFAFSGLGKYSYALFDHPLSPSQIKTYNDRCKYIYYDQALVLMYEGGAAGAQCFPD